MMTLPRGWKMLKVSELGDVQAGRQRSPHFVEGELRPYLRVANVYDGFIDKSDVLKMFFTEKEFTRYRLKPGDILLNEGQSLELVGRPAMYKGDPPDCCFQNTLVRFSPNGKCSSSFALVLFQYCLAVGIFASIASQTTSIAHLGVSRFANLALPIPPKSEQGKIVNILAPWDRAINQTEDLIAAKGKRQKALIQQLLTGKRRFAEFIRSKGYRKTRYYHLPEDWQYTSIGKVAKEVSLRNGSSDNVPVLSCTKHQGLVDSLSYFGKRIYSSDTANYKVVPRGAFAYATNHIEEGSIGYQDFYDKALISPIYTVFETNDMVKDEFLFKLLKTEWYRHIFEVRTSSSVDRRGSLRWNDFAKIKIPLPPIDEQKKISATVDIFSNEIMALTKQARALKTQKRGLMQQLLTGKTRVKLDA